MNHPTGPGGYVPISAFVRCNHCGGRVHPDEAHYPHVDGCAWLYGDDAHEPECTCTPAAVHPECCPECAR